MGVNKAILIGNLGRDPELRYTPQNTAVCTLKVATGERRKDASGNWVDHTEWHSVVVFGKTAENCSKYLAKGRQVFIEGRIQTRKWQDKEGKDRYSTEIVGSNVQFIGGGAGNASKSDLAVEEVSENSSSNTSPAPMAAASSAAADISFDDDDIPF